jgi:hypothetical protein
MATKIKMTVTKPKATVKAKSSAKAKVMSKVASANKGKQKSGY